MRSVDEVRRSVACGVVSVRRVSLRRRSVSPSVRRVFLCRKAKGFSLWFMVGHITYSFIDVDERDEHERLFFVIKKLLSSTPRACRMQSAAAHGAHTTVTTAIAAAAARAAATRGPHASHGRASTRVNR